ncbi:UNKNOWN [Stylonychia lemnae]|uniref:Uncharacterized protein n=1 Tax=Stylonychia lemnae TaxID=5949 RepID=A0A078A0R7_STYLE|nr:UNKNOWN [Stylonychia lemnae]|eukprot:CDW75796.1 UNKNOWN [Stylonychia lemnae]
MSTTGAMSPRRQSLMTQEVQKSKQACKIWILKKIRQWDQIFNNIKFLQILHLITKKWRKLEQDAIKIQLKRSKSKQFDSQRLNYNQRSAGNLINENFALNILMQLKSQLGKVEFELNSKQMMLEKFQKEYELIMKQKAAPLNISQLQSSRYLDFQHSRLYSSQSMRSINGRLVENSIHKGYDNYLNSQSMEQLEEKLEFLKVKLDQIRDFDIEETAESLKLELVGQRLKKQKLFDYQKYQHTVPEFRKIINMTDSMKQAFFLSQTSMITSVSGFQRCKENLLDIKIKNREKIKIKQQEQQHHENEVKAMKFMVTQKSNKYQEAKKLLEELKRRNREINIDQMKQDLYKIRVSELLKLIDALLLAALLRYYKDHQGKIEASDQNLELFELKMSFDSHQSEKTNYSKFYSFDDMTPEISILVQQKFNVLQEFENFNGENLQKLSEFIEEKTVYNQSLQLKSKEITIELSKRKQYIESLNTQLDYARFELSRKQNNSNDSQNIVLTPKLTKMIQESDDTQYIYYQKLYTKQQLATLQSMIESKQSKIEDYRQFVKNLNLKLSDMVLKFSAKLLKIREYLPYNLISDHFPQQLLQILGTYQKISKKKTASSPPIHIQKASNIKLEINIAPQSARKKSDQSDDDASTIKKLEDDSDNEDSFAKRAQDEIKHLQKSANELKVLKKTKQLENQMNLKQSKQQDPDSDQSQLFIKKTNPKKAELQELWRKIEEQQKMLDQPLDTANTLKLTLQKAIRKLVESCKQTLHLKMLVFQIDFNRCDLLDLLSCDNLELEEYEISQRKFNKHYDECYQKLNFETRNFKKAKLTKAQTISELGENQEYNENSFLNHQYEKEKNEFEKRLKEKLYGKRKKKSKYTIKERKKIRFFNGLHKRGLNPDKVSSHQTNVQYTQVFKTISNYQKSETRFINKMVNEFDEAAKKISTASGYIPLPKKWSQTSMSQSPKHEAKRQETVIVDTRKATFQGSQNLNFSNAVGVSKFRTNSGKRASIRSNTQQALGRRKEETPQSVTDDSQSDNFETKSEEERRKQRIQTLKSRFSIARGMSQVINIQSMDTFKFPNLQVPMNVIHEHKRGLSNAVSLNTLHTPLTAQSQGTTNVPNQSNSQSNTRNISTGNKNQSQWFNNKSHARPFNFKIIKDRNLINSQANHSTQLNTQSQVLLDQQYKSFNMRINKTNQTSTLKAINSDISNLEFQNDNGRNSVHQEQDDPSNKIDVSQSPERKKLVVSANPGKRFEKISKIYDREVKSRGQNIRLYL